MTSVSRGQVSLRIPKEPDVGAMTKGIMKTFPRRLNRGFVKPAQVERLVRRLVDKCTARRNSEGSMPSSSPKAGAEAEEEDELDIFSEDVDLNLVSPEKLQVRKTRRASPCGRASRTLLNGVFITPRRRHPTASDRLVMVHHHD